VCKLIFGLRTFNLPVSKKLLSACLASHKGDPTQIDRETCTEDEELQWIKGSCWQGGSLFRAQNTQGTRNEAIES
jgi:hypothetical protein